MPASAHLTSGVLAAVLGAALLHAAWNSLVKSADDKFLSSALVSLSSGADAFAAALVLPWPAPRSLPFIGASALIHVVYFLFIGRLYRSADLSVAYPVMRGLAPLFAAVLALAVLGEALGPVAAAGVAILVGGVMLMSASGLAHGRIDAAALLVAVMNSLVTAAYTVIDGQGARISGEGALFAFAYNSWADALRGLVYAPIVFALRGRAAGVALARGWRRGLMGGLAAFLAYAIVVSAMTQAPIAAVAALRETSIVFAALIVVTFLGEPFRAQRATATLIVLVGVVALKLG
jgi:drug/metabolite transporter (DMT)-like permease